MAETITLQKSEFENIINEIKFIKQNYVSKSELNYLQWSKDKNLFDAFTKAGKNNNIEECFSAQQEILENE